MTQAYSRTMDTESEVIKILVAISKVSARMARNMTVLAQQRRFEKGENRYEQNERTGYDYRRTTQLSRCY